MREVSDNSSSTDMIRSAEKTAPWKIESNVVSWCPTMDMVVFAPQSGLQIALYRRSGQRVWSSNNRKSSKAVYSAWKNNGKSLAIVYDDDSYQIFSTSTGKILHTSPPKTVSYIKWTEKSSIESEDSNSSKIIDIDVLKHLPHLSQLPSGHQLITRLPNMDLSSTPIEFLTEGTVTGDFGLDIYGFFPIGGKNIGTGVNARIISVTALNDLSKHFILTRTESGELAFTVFNTRIVQKVGMNYLPEITLIPSMILAASSYIRDALETLARESKTSEESTNRLVQQFGSEDHLAEELFNTLLTGVFSSDLSNWLDTVNENGFKKYGTSVWNSYDSSKKVLFENILPACERNLLLLSRIRGLARWTDRGSAMGLDPVLIDRCMTSLTQITEECHQLLWALCEEIELFRSFVSWLQNCFEKFLERTMNKTGLENITKSEVRTKTVAKYIRNLFNRPSVSLNKVNDILSSIGSFTLECHQAFDQIKTALRDQCLPDEPISLCTAFHRAGMRNINDEMISIYSQPNENSSELILFKMRRDTDTQVSKCIINVNDKPFTQCEFIDNDEMIILQVDKMIRFNYREIDSSEMVIGDAPGYTIINLNGFIPKFMALNSRQKIKMCCLIGQDSQHYKIFDLDENEE